MAKNNFQGGGGPSQRQLRVAETIRRALSDVLLRGDIHDEELAHLSITVGEVRITPDLRNATVFVLPLGGVNTDEVTEALNRNKVEIRRLINKLLSLRFSPELKFLPDRSFDQMDETRRLLDNEVVKRDVENDHSE